jgi:hypothetical protein
MVYAPREEHELELVERLARASPRSPAAGALTASPDQGDQFSRSLGRGRPSGRDLWNEHRPAERDNRLL